MKRRAVLYLVIAALLWSTGGILIKLVAWNPMAIASMRSALAACTILWCRRRLRFSREPAQWMGAVCYAATVCLFVVANKYTTAANAILLQYTAPIYVALFSSWFLQERVTRVDLVAIFSAMCGITLFFMDDLSAGGFAGNIVALCSGAAFAGTALFLRKQKAGSPVESIFMGNILAFLMGLPFLSKPFPSVRGWAGLISLVVFQLGLSYMLYAEAVKYVSALEAILIPVIEPILNPTWAFLFLDERPGPWAIAGGIIVLVSVTARCIPAVRPQGIDNKT